MDWEAWGLTDYPLLIKNPMDLGLVQRNLEKGVYATPTEYADDVHLTLDNCMTYNRDDSEYYAMAARLKVVFDDKFGKIKWKAAEAAAVTAPTVAEKKSFSQNMYQIGSEDMGHVVQMLDQRCESSIKQIDPDDIEIDVDAIDAATFWAVDKFVKECLPKAGAGAKKKAGKGDSGRGGKRTKVGS